MEVVDKGRALEVNAMCAASDELLTNTIKKRKYYPQKIKESLSMKNDVEMMHLVCLKTKYLKVR